MTEVRTRGEVEEGFAVFLPSTPLSFAARIGNFGKGPVTFYNLIILIIKLMGQIGTTFFDICKKDHNMFIREGISDIGTSLGQSGLVGW